MNHEVYKLIHSHSSVRSYLNKDIPENVLTRILEAALRASSSGNMQSYSIIITKDVSIKKKLLKPHFKQSMVTEAPVLLTFCADFNRMRKWLKISKAPENFDNFISFMIASIDAILAAQNAALAAESEGLGICFMGTTLANCDQIAAILNCPENVIPVVGFALGYSAEKKLTRNRLPLNGVVHRERYKDYVTSEILEIYQEKEDEGYNRYLLIPELRQKIEKVGAKNLAQIYTKAKYTKKSHLKYSKTVLDFIKSQNFLNSK